MRKSLKMRRISVIVLAGLAIAGATSSTLAADKVAGATLSESGNACIPPAPGTDITPEVWFDSIWGDCRPLIICGVAPTLLVSPSLPEPVVTLDTGVSNASYGFSNPACAISLGAGSLSIASTSVFALADSPAGFGWMQQSRPVIEMVFSTSTGGEGAGAAGDRIILYLSATKILQFKRHDNDPTLFYGINGATGVFKLTTRQSGDPDSTWDYYDRDGNVYTFFGFDATSGNEVIMGQLWKIRNMDGRSGCATSYLGHATTMSSAVSSGFHVDGSSNLTSLPAKWVDSAGREIIYTYTTVGGVERYSTITTNDLTGGSHEVQKTTFEYYTSWVADEGAVGDLKYVKVTNHLSGGVTVDTMQYMRYYTASNATPPVDDWSTSEPGHPHQLKLMLDAEGCRRWNAANPSSLPHTGSDANLKEYASQYLKYYDSDGDVDGNVATTTGNIAFRKYKVWQYTSTTECTSCGGSPAATDTITLDYIENTQSGAVNSSSTYDASGDWDYLHWRSRTVVKNPDVMINGSLYASYKVFYFDEYGQKLADITADGDPRTTSPNFWVTKIERDSLGRIATVYSPESITSFTFATGAITKSTTDGLVNYTEYDSAVPGTAVSRTLHGKGPATPYIDSVITYVATGEQDRVLGASSGNKAIVRKALPATIKSYKTEVATGGSGGSAGTDYDQTTIDYTFHTASGVDWLVKSIARTRPNVSTTQNGSGSGAGTPDSITRTYMREDGRTVFSRTADNRYTYFEYDSVTGQMTKRIEDVQDAGSGPVFDAESAFGLSLSTPTTNLSTVYTYDEQGRMDTATLPTGRVTALWYTKLADGRLVTLSVPRRTGSGTFTYYGPVGYSVANHAGASEASGLIGLGTGTGIYDVESDNHATTIASWIDTSKSDPIEAVSASYGKVKRLRVTEYLKNGAKPTKSKAIYTLGSTVAGSASDDSYVYYDEMGRAIRSVDATGTISRTNFDVIGRPTSQWTGTNDHDFPQGSASGPDNMAEVSRQYFDGGDETTPIVIGNHRVTSRIVDEDGDWSSGHTDDQRLTSMIYDYRGRLIVQSNPAAPHRVMKYDNRGRKIASGTFSSTSGFDATTNPTATTMSARRSLSETFFDERGQVWKSVQHKIDQSSGAIHSTEELVTLNWRDPDGRLIKTISPSGLSKTKYDRMNRVTQQYTLASTNDTGYPDAGDVSGDLVLDQMVTNYDDASGVVMWSMSLARLPHDTTTAGALDSSGQPNASLSRAQITEMWYDLLDRPVVTAQYGTKHATSNGAAYSRAGSLPVPAAGNPDVLVTEVRYNKDGTVFEVEDPKQLVTRYGYDAAGRKITTISNYKDGSPNNDEDNFVRTVYTNGQMTALWVDMDGDGTQDLDTTGAVPHDQVTTYVYGTTKGTLSVSSTPVSQIASNRLVSEVVYPPQTASDSGSPGTTYRSVIYAYNALGERVLTKDQNGTVLHTTFDDGGRRAAQIADSIGSDIDGWVRRMVYSYTDRGQVSAVTQFDAVTSGSAVNGIAYEYDDWGNVTAFKQDYDSAVGPSGNEKTVEWTYELATPTGGRSNVRRTQEALPDGALVNYGFGTSNGFNDVAGRVETVKVDLGSEPTVASYEYLGSSQMVTQNLDVTGLTNTAHSSGSFSGKWDRYNRVISNTWANGNTAQQFDISYDNNSNITLVKDPILDDLDGSLVHSFSTKFTMDGRNRITRGDRGVESSGSIGGTQRVNQLWTLGQTGNWTGIINDLDGDDAGTGTDETEEERTFSDANEIMTRVDPSATLLHDKAGQLTDEGRLYKFVYDAWGRLTKVTERTGTPPPPIAEYKYDALGQRIGWHYDTTRSGGGLPDTVVDSNDPWYWFIYDDHWRIVNTYRVASGTIDTYAKERFVHHAAGLDGRGRSSYVDSMILADRDLTTTWSSAADDTAEARYFYLQNWRADTCAITNANGAIVRNFRYTAYGTRTEVNAADYNRDGVIDHFDYLDWADQYSGEVPKSDMNNDGEYDFFDYLEFVDVTDTDGDDQGGGRIRNLYAGYENDLVLETGAPSANGSEMLSYNSYYHVRNRVYSTELGRWTRRDPLGYVDGMGLYEYCGGSPEAWYDPLGLCGECGVSQVVMPPQPTIPSTVPPAERIPGRRPAVPPADRPRTVPMRPSERPVPVPQPTEQKQPGLKPSDLQRFIPIYGQCKAAAEIGWEIGTLLETVIFPEIDPFVQMPFQVPQISSAECDDAKLRRDQYCGNANGTQGAGFSPNKLPRFNPTNPQSLKDYCDKVQQFRLNAEACKQARLDVSVYCFGVQDDRHREHIDRMIDPSIDELACLQARWCTSSPPAATGPKWQEQQAIRDCIDARRKSR